MRKANSSLYTPAIVGRGRACHEPCHFGSSQVKKKKKKPRLYLKPNAHEQGILLFKVFVYIILRGFWYPYGLCLCKRTCLNHVKIWYAINSELLWHSLLQCSKREGGLQKRSWTSKCSSQKHSCGISATGVCSKKQKTQCPVALLASLHNLKILNFLSAFK